MLKQSVQHHRLILEMESIRTFLLGETDTHNGLAGEISRKDTLSKKPTWRTQRTSHARRTGKSGDVMDRVTIQ